MNRVVDVCFQIQFFEILNRRSAIADNIINAYRMRYIESESTRMGLM